MSEEEKKKAFVRELSLNKSLDNAVDAFVAAAGERDALQAKIAALEQQVHDLTARAKANEMARDRAFEIATQALTDRDAARARAERLHAALTRCVNLIGECEYGANEDGTCPGDPPGVDICQYCEGVAALTLADSGDAAIVQAMREAEERLTEVYEAVGWQIETEQQVDWWWRKWHAMAGTALAGLRRVVGKGE